MMRLWRYPAPYRYIRKTDAMNAAIADISTEFETDPDQVREDLLAKLANAFNMHPLPEPTQH